MAEAVGFSHPNCPRQPKVFHDDGQAG